MVLVIAGLRLWLLWDKHAVADRLIFVGQGQIVEQNTPIEFFTQPRNERSRYFLSKTLGH